MILTSVLLLLGQISDPVASTAGWAGWASFLTSGGVLVWLLFKHLPEKDARDERKTQLLVESLKQARDAYREDLKAVAEHCRGEMTQVANAFSREVDRIVEALARGNSCANFRRRGDGE